MHLQYLNNDISDRIYAQKTQNWRAFITILNHKTGTRKFYKTLKCIAQSNTVITTSHAAKGASNSIIIIVIKKIGNARPGKGDLHPISPKTPAPHYQPIEEKKRKGK